MPQLCFVTCEILRKHATIRRVSNLTNFAASGGNENGRRFSSKYNADRNKTVRRNYISQELVVDVDTRRETRRRQYPAQIKREQSDEGQEFLVCGREGHLRDFRELHIRGV